LQSLITEMGNRKEAIGVTSILEGEEVYTAVSRVGATQWTVALGASKATVQSALWRTAGLYTGGVLVSLLLGVFAAWRVALSITGRVASLRQNAVALGLGHRFAAPAAGLPELDAVSDAMSKAASQREEYEADHARLLDAARSAHASAESARGRLQILLNATSRLSQSLEEAVTLRTMAEALVPGIADMCRIDLVDSEGVVQREFTYHRDPSRVEAIDRVVNLGHVSGGAQGSFPWVMAHGRAHVQDFDATSRDDIADPSFRQFVEVTGMRAVCVVPLVARGHTIGAVAAIQAESGRRFTSDDASLVGELAQRGALALDNARLHAECTNALRQAHAANHTKDEFLAMLGHELRNPLAPILMALEVVKRRDPHAFANERQIIERQAKQLLHLVNDLLDVSRIVAGKIQLRPEAIDLRSVVDRAVEITKPTFDKRSTPPVVMVPAEPVQIRGDLLRLAQVTSNLLDNAAKFSEPDQAVLIEVKQAGNKAMLIVSDEGSGIPDALLPHIFDRFVQQEQAIHRQQGGLGLGLAIARSIVELHGGTIAAAHQHDGHGTRMTITLPMLDTGSGELLSNTATAVRAALALRVLIVDDNADAAQMLATVLTLEGNEVRTASNAEEALRAIGEFGPTVCFLDIGLPGVNGYELAAALRQDEKTQYLFLIALTGYGQQADRDRALEAGFDHHLAKPAHVDTVQALLRSLRQRPSDVPEARRKIDTA
jgi:signal transduction histidine kinase/ActR/RegA family two-component response regulator